LRAFLARNPVAGVDGAGAFRVLLLVEIEEHPKSALDANMTILETRTAWRH
jgi:hypothetical protein